MAVPSCPGCRERDAVIAAALERIAALEQRVRDLEARLGQNATNSSLPPSANPPQAPSHTAAGPQAGRQDTHRQEARRPAGARRPPEAPPAPGTADAHHPLRTPAL